MDPIICDVCGRSATVHMTEIHDGAKTTRHTCTEHSGLRDIPSLAPGQMAVNGVPYSTIQQGLAYGIIDNLRGAANFARLHGRMPTSVAELREGMAFQGDLTHAEVTDPKVHAELQQLDVMISFWQTRGRMPQTPDKLPPTSPETQ